MLLEFSFSNHKSIKDEAAFSMIASVDNIRKEFLKTFAKHKVLPSIAIYGPNGSGKSNFINALEYVRALILNSANYKVDGGIPQYPHKANKKSAASTYDIQFTKDDIRYSYSFSILKNAVSEEHLCYYPLGKQVKIFDRKGSKVIPGDRFKTAFNISRSLLKDYNLLLSCAAVYSDVPEIDRAVEFFKEDLVIYNPQASNWTERSVELMQNDSEIRSIFVEFLKSLGCGITDIDVKLDKAKINPSDLPAEISEHYKALIAMKDVNKLEAKVIYGKLKIDLLTEESAGIKKLFEIMCPMIDALRTGKVFICDGLEKDLHEMVVRYIIKMFNQKEHEHFAQLIFTTNDISLLESGLFRRDQVWFTDIDDKKTTKLYSLADIRNVRRKENLANGYMSGKYGGIPKVTGSKIGGEK